MIELDKNSLENEIVDALLTKLGSSRNLSGKAKIRIAKSARKLAERLSIIFEKQERKAARKAGEFEIEAKLPVPEDNPHDSSANP